MEIQPYLKKQLDFSHGLVDDALEALTPDQLAWLPPGTASPIGVIALHVLTSENTLLSFITGQPRLWDTQNWGARFNLPTPPQIGQDWTTHRAGTYQLADLVALRDAVFAVTNAYFDTITPAELDRPVKLGSSDSNVAGVLAILIGHAAMHAGEIAALKGVHGEKGLSY